MGNILSLKGFKRGIIKKKKKQFVSMAILMYMTKIAPYNRAAQTGMPWDSTAFGAQGYRPIRYGYRLVLLAGV